MSTVARMGRRKETWMGRREPRSLLDIGLDGEKETDRRSKKGQHNTRPGQIDSRILPHLCCDVNNDGSSPLMKPSITQVTLSNCRHSKLVMALTMVSLGTWGYSQSTTVLETDSVISISSEL